MGGCALFVWGKANLSMKKLKAFCLEGIHNNYTELLKGGMICVRKQEKVK
jgi:hypothetical protein